jgi:hypothetical protein
MLIKNVYLLIPALLNCTGYVPLKENERRSLEIKVRRFLGLFHGYLPAKAKTTK